MLVLPPLLFGILMVDTVRGRQGRTQLAAAADCGPSVIVVFASFVVLTYLGCTAPWSPEMEAWSGTPVPEKMISWAGSGEHEDRTSLTPQQLQGAVVLQNKDCRNCHALDGKGGQRGPDLNGVATRLTARSAGPPGYPGRRQHAGLWQATQAGRGDRPGRFPVHVEAAWTTTGAEPG